MMINHFFNSTLFSKASSQNLLLLLSLFLVISPHLVRLPVLLSLFCCLILVWRLFYEAGKMAFPGKIIRFFLMIIGIVGVLSSYHTIVGRHAGTALLIIMLCLKLTEFKTSRDATVIVFLGYFIVITSFLFSQSIPIAIYMMVTVILLTTTLIAFQHQTQSQTQHIKLASQLLLYSIPLAIVLFLLFPRVSGPLWGLPEDAFNARTGITDTMSPGNISNLTNSYEVAFRVKFDKNIPQPEHRYWRGPVLWSYDGNTWTAPEYERIESPFINYQGYSEATSYTVTLEPHQQHWLFALDIPATIPNQAKLTPELQILSYKPVTQVKRYSLTSYSQYQLPAHDYLSPRRYLALPENISPRAQLLIDQWKSKYRSSQQIINQALDYFMQNDFYYSRKPPLLFDDPVDEFLFATRKGYCEHYASAFTVLMRMAGIPARVITGYYGGEINPLGNYMIIRQSDAHAWSEVYLKDKGWLRIDPTSVIPPDRIEANEDIVRIQPDSSKAITLGKDISWLNQSFKSLHNLVDSINNIWNQWVIGYNNNKQVALFKAFGVPEITWQGLSTLLFIILAAFLSVFSFFILKSREQTDSVAKIYLRFCRKMQKAGFKKLENETASTFARRVVTDIPDKKLAIMKITSTYNILHYGKYKTRSLVQAFSESVNTFKI
jgi:transglutaminase-like putative cysteine protease